MSLCRVFHAYLLTVSRLLLAVPLPKWDFFTGNSRQFLSGEGKKTVKADVLAVFQTKMDVGKSLLKYLPLLSTAPFDEDPDMYGQWLVKPMVLSMILLTGICGLAHGQFEVLGNQAGANPQRVKHQWRVGLVIQAQNGPCAGIYATVPVPVEWDNQQVRIINEEISPEIGSVRYRTLDHGLKQMMIVISRLNPGQQAMAVITFEVVSNPLPAPKETESLVIPKRPSRDVRLYLGSSPYIDSRHARIRDQARKIVADKETAWKQVEAIYDWVRNSVELRDGNLKGATAALRDGFGQKEDLTSLFIALCRAHRVPTRTVWVPNHNYAEFYLADEAGKGRWYPCELVGTRAFGQLPQQRPILMRGDNFRVPEKKESQRYVAEFLKGKTGRGLAKPNVQFVRELVASEVLD